MKRLYIIFSFLLVCFLLSNSGLSQFKYENGVWIKNNTAGALTNVQVLIKFNTQVPIGLGWMQADGKDIVFTSTCGGSNYLSHFVEGYLNTDSTKIWVKVPAIGASDSTLVYLYYGNPGATNLSTINVFDGPNSATDSVVVATTNTVSLCQRGFRFTCNQDVIVGYFGKRIPNATQRYVTLFDYTTQAIIAQIQVDAGTAGVYNYNTVTPFWLRAGKDYVLELFNGSGDMYYYGNSTQIGQAFTYISMLYCNSCTQNTFPTTTLSGLHYGCPDLLYYTFQNVTPAPTARILLAADTTTPAAPTNVIATAGSGLALIQWNRNTEFDIASYNIYKNTVNNPGTATLAGTVNYTDSLFTATGLANGTWYFWVRAVDRYCTPKMSPYSTVASCTLGGITYPVPELIYYKFENNPSTTLTPNFASAPVGTNPAPIVGQTVGAGGQFDSCLIGNAGAGSAVTPAWNWNVTGNWTIGFWVSALAETSSGSPTYLFGDPGSTTFRCFYGGAAYPNYMYLRGPFSATGHLIPCTMPGSWYYHIVWNGTAILIYQNGVLLQTNTEANVMPTGTGFKVGGYSTTSYSLNVGGKMDEFRLYNRALTAAEISSTWNHELPYTVTEVNNTTSIIPDKFYLNQNYPNPFNPSTTIKYGLKNSANVLINIYDALGRNVRTLVNEKQPAGNYEISFNAHDLSSGIYFYKISAGDFTDTKKMLLIK